MGDDITPHDLIFICVSISIHVPRVGDDAEIDEINKKVRAFQSTSPAWGTTPDCGFVLLDKLISIHVPRVGDD